MWDVGPTSEGAKVSVFEERSGKKSINRNIYIWWVGRHEGHPTWCWRCKCVQWKKEDSSNDINFSRVQIHTPPIRGWISDADQGMTRGPRGQADPKKEWSLFEVTARISHCTVKWQNILLANGRNDLNIHFEVVSRKKPSRHLQSECLSPRVFCRTFRTRAPHRHHAIWVLRVCREKSKIWSHSCS